MLAEKHGEKEKKKRDRKEKMMGREFTKAHWRGRSKELKKSNGGKEKWFNRYSRSEINLNHGWDWEW